MNGVHTGDPYEYPGQKAGDIVKAKFIKYNFNCTSDYIEKDYSTLRSTPSISQLKTGFPIIKYIDLADGDKPFKTNMAVSGCSSEDNIQLGWVVAGANAIIRNKTPDYMGNLGKLIQGREVDILKNYTKTRCEIRYKGETETHATSTDNLQPILSVKREGDYHVTSQQSIYGMAYSPNEKRKINPTEIFQITKVCGDYYLARNQNGDLGWVLKKHVRKTPKDKTNDFEFLTGLSTSDYTKLKQDDINKIFENRKKINDRTDKEVYNPYLSDPAGYENGYMYTNRKADVKVVIDFVTGIEKIIVEQIYEELAHEGSFSAINSYDGEYFTWGKGFAAKGGLPDFLKALMKKNDNYKRIFLEVGLRVDDNGWLQVLTKEGVWKKDDFSNKNDYKFGASEIIRNDPQLLSFFIEFAEKSVYAQDVANAQVEAVMKDGAAGDYPDYIFDKEKDAYTDNWNNASIRVLSHFSHWLPGRTWAKSRSADRYKATKGEWSKILYEYIYHSSRMSEYRTGEIIVTDICRWRTSKYNIMKSALEAFGTPRGIGKTKLYEKWNEHEIDLEYVKDKAGVLRAKKVGEKKYLSNSQITLIQLSDDKTLVITKDAEAIKYNDFED